MGEGEMDPKEIFRLDQAEGEAEVNRHETAHLDRLSTETDLLRAGAEQTRAKAALMKGFANLIGAITVLGTIYAFAWMIAGVLVFFGIVHQR